MEINQLFGGQRPQRNQEQNESRETLQLKVKAACACGDLSAQPLIYGLQKSLVQHDFSLKLSDPQTCTHHLVEGDVELALIPSIAYVQAKGAWKIIPQICLANHEEPGDMALFFNKGLHTLHRIAFDERYPTAVTLLQIILREKYEMEPELIPMKGDLEIMLNQADAVLLAGNRALRAQEAFPAHLDLVEEWIDLTGLPFVSAFWAGHELSLTEEIAQILQKSAEIGQSNREKIAKEFAAGEGGNVELYKRYLTDSLRYTFGENEKQGLKEFFNYAFYLGMIEYIPDLHFLGEEDKAK